MCEISAFYTAASLIVFFHFSARQRITIVNVFTHPHTHTQIANAIRRNAASAVNVARLASAPVRRAMRLEKPAPVAVRRRSDNIEAE